MPPMKMKWSTFLLFCAMACPAFAMADEPAPAAAVAAATAEAADPSGYQLQPGDVLTVTVWKETDLQGDVLIRPDGGLSFALAGELHAASEQPRTTHSIKRKSMRMPNKPWNGWEGKTAIINRRPSSAVRTRRG